MSLGRGRCLDLHSSWWSQRRFVSRPGHCIDRFGGDASGYTACHDLPNARRIPPLASVLSPGASGVRHCWWQFGSAVLAESSSVGPSATAAAEHWRICSGVSAISSNRLHPPPRAKPELLQPGLIIVWLSRTVKPTLGLASGSETPSRWLAVASFPIGA